ncbi:hypothetical protein P171DRAFT_517708 [Karstenula rhodostoma CBS 690.94]|uniref:Uncharacterized protein n=1 Tax=Karstenula rhodostoma CBS 690.94 TaxID=1392251 RepID=A0A9P4PPY5_9PLEO|nr:hypothetical protein P171DRAFT_517708 [Karstenula rhodostoma CBS 690.94]
MPEPRKGPFTLVTVNTAPDRAKRLIARMVDGLSDCYDIAHVDNCSSIDQVGVKVRQHKPNLLFSASMWSPEEARKIRAIAERERPGIKIHAIPQGLQVERGPDAIVEYLLEHVPALLETVEVE